MIKISSQEELKEYLDSRDIKIYERFARTNYSFLIYYFDNKSNTVVFKDIVTTPEVSLRKFPQISNETKLPVTDFDIVLKGCLNEQTNEYINMDMDLDYHIYFKDEDKQQSTDNLSTK